VQKVTPVAPFILCVTMVICNKFCVMKQRNETLARERVRAKAKFV
jgi:hypothetical protein